MENHASCDYSRLLNKYCPAPSLRTFTFRGICQKNGKKEIEELESALALLTKMNTSFDDVVQYLWNVLQELLPKHFSVPTEIKCIPLEAAFCGVQPIRCCQVTTANYVPKTKRDELVTQT